MMEWDVVAVINEVPVISWNVMDSATKERAQPSLPNKLLESCDEDEGDEEKNAGCYSCWTCGASYETGRALEFLRHIVKCCKE